MKTAFKEYWKACILTAIGVLVSPGAMAKSPYYLGVETGHEHLSFKPEYSFVSGAPNQSFDNRTQGSLVGVVGGYHWKTAANFYMNVEGRLSVSDSKWTLTLPDAQAEFRYDLPISMAFSLVPAYRITENFSVYSEAGLTLGMIRERKLTATAAESRYDESTWRPGAVFGFGVSVAVADGWSVRSGYRRSWYRNHNYHTHDRAGTRVETINSNVEQSTTTISLIKNF